MKNSDFLLLQKVIFAPVTRLCCSCMYLFVSVRCAVSFNDYFYLSLYLLPIS